MKHIKIAAGLAHVNYGRIADIVIAADKAGVDYIHSDAADMIDLKNMQLMGGHQIIQGMYLCKPGAEGQNDDGRRVQLLGSGTILRESLAAQVLLAAEWGIQADVWSCPSFNELAREGQDCERWNLLHPLEAPRTSFVARQLGGHAGPVVASTDYMKSYAEQIRPFIPAGRGYKVLGTDGFGRSDFRSKLREHFEINRHYIVVAALKALSEQGSVPVAKVAEAIAKYGIQADKINPLYA